VPLMVAVLEIEPVTGTAAAGLGETTTCKIAGVPTASLPMLKVRKKEPALGAVRPVRPGTPQIEESLTHVIASCVQTLMI